MSALTVSASAHQTIEIRTTVLSSLTPADQTRGWQRRWQEIQQQAAALAAPLTGPMPTDAIHSARQRVESFYVNAYHLKDLLKADPAVTISDKAIEQAITRNLALLADLANVVKHGHLSQPPRSGDTPKIRCWKGIEVPDGGWRIRLDIEHNGQKLDGLQIVADSVTAWELTLKSWHLI